MLKECSYQFVYSIKKGFSIVVIDKGKYLFESLIIKQCGRYTCISYFITGDIIREGVKSFCQ